MLVKVHLTGMIEFLKNGGDFSEIRTDDVRKFYMRMGEKTSSIKYPLMGIHKISTYHMLTLLKLKQKEYSNYFIDVAIK